MLFFYDLGKTWLQMPWMHVKLGFVFALLFISWQMPSDIQTIAKQRNKTYDKLHATME
jgi:uncharacterized membrane protein